MLGKELPMVCLVAPDGRDGAMACLADAGIVDHMDCDDCDEEYVFAMRQGDREFALGLRTVLECLAFAEHEMAVPELPQDWWIKVNTRYR